MSANDTLAELLVRYEDMLRQGQAPAAEEMCRECPELLDEFKNRAAYLEAKRSFFSPTEKGGQTIQVDGLEKAAAKEPLPEIAGFQVLEKLGQGGMGVVYKAWQPGLKRLVALKMILAGEHAGPQQRARFRTEAQAVAQLQHANIVQIYEIGEHRGRPFFCLEFVDGGNLARLLDHQPQPPEHAARLVETLARAMHYTHQRGIVHRDLKPANVLLAVSDQPSAISKEGTCLRPNAESCLLTAVPKITDFGLAKQLQSDVGQTQTGAVMGTPSYMAPEQAAGKTRDIGPPADIYALGAILYELLTGRPPFQADSTMETLRQVLHEEPPPPSRLRAGIPRDLETICLKALAKEPGQRYASALALAQDLERFGAGEPILARREGLLRRLGRKVRKNRRLVAAGLLILLACASAVYFSLSARTAGRLADFSKTFEPRLKQIQWTGEFLDDMEAMIAPIQSLDPQRAQAAREELYDHYRRSIRQVLQSESALSTEDIGQLEKGLKPLETRHAKAHAELGKELTARLGHLQIILDVRFPFVATQEVFQPPVVLVDRRPKGKALLSPLPKSEVIAQVIHRPLPKIEDGFVLTREACQGNVEMEADFSFPAWGSARQVGLVLDASPDKKSHYGFVLGAGEAYKVDDKGIPIGPTLGQARAGKKSIFLKILRNGVLLQQVAVEGLADRDLTFRAKREGSLLTFEVLHNRTLVSGVRFLDLFPLGGKEAGVFGLLWPADVALNSMVLRRQTRAPKPGDLEQADHLYSLGKLEEALTVFQKHTSQEARCKQGLCLVALKSNDEAARLLAPLVNEAGERWPLVAGCQLWVIYLLQNNRTEADAVCDFLLTRGYTVEQLAAVIPLDLRESIWSKYSAKSSVFTLLFRPKQQELVGLERIAAIYDFLQADEVQRFYLRWDLARAYRLMGQSRKALQYIERWLREDPFVNWERYIRARLVEEFGWLTRELGEVHRAGPLVNALLDGKEDPALLYLLVERARLCIAQKGWHAAEKDLDLYLQRVPKDTPDYYHFAGACLARGFLYARAGDEKKAQETWRLGLLDLTRNPKTYQDLLVPAGNAGGGMSLLQASVLASLTNQFSEADADRYLERLVSTLPPEYATAVKLMEFRLPASVLRAMWQSPRGRAFAEQVAFQNASLADTLKIPFLLAFFTLLRQQAMPAAITPDQETLVWKLTEDFVAALSQGRFNTAQVFQFLQAYKGTTGVFGWSGLAKTLEPNLRGPIAYVLGHRYLRFNPPRPNEAANLFRTAQKDAPPNSSLLRLAQAELQRLEKK